MRYGVIGLGNMASAILKGMVESGNFKNDELTGYDMSGEKTLAAQTAFGLLPAADARAVAASSDVLLLAVKPQNLPQVLPDIAPVLKKQTVVATIAAGKDLAFYASFLPEGTPVVRLMPNINAKVKAATTALCPNAFVSDAQREAVRAMFSSVGSVVALEEKDFPVFGAVAGSSVAFVYMYIAALIDAEKKAGLSDEAARKIAADSVLGSAKLVLGCEEDPRDLARQVCSPGGTTIEGVTLLRDRRFEENVIDAIDAILRKDEILRKG